MVAMRDGKIIGEWYSGGRTAASQSLAYSSSKPLTTAVIGAAQKLGLLSIDQSIADFIPEFKGTPKADITIRHLLTHKSGLKSSNAEFSSAMRLGSGITSAAINLPLTTPPGSTYDYESSVLALQLLVRVVEKAVSEKFSTFADKYVLRPLGMMNSVYKGDQPATNFETGDPWLAGGLSTTCRDLTRLGHLFQLKGQWAGQQIFTSEFAAQAIPVSGYGMLLSGGVVGYGHDGACGQMVLTMPSGVTISSMSNSSLASPLMGACEPDRISSLRQATIAVANLL
jgi:CubicO group peptidase (beta-lactamase class C family)